VRRKETVRLKGTIETLIGGTAAGLMSLVVTVDCSWVWVMEYEQYDIVHTSDGMEGI
jgi:hypothetical protein